MVIAARHPWLAPSAQDFIVLGFFELRTARKTRNGFASNVRVFRGSVYFASFPEP